MTDIMNHDEIKFLLGSFDWSFSRINSYKTCRRMFYMQYVQHPKPKGDDNFFSEFGIFNHTIFQKYYENELEFFELSDYYKENYYNVVKHQAPPNRYVNLNTKYYDTGENYWNTFEGLFDEYEILGVEEKFKIKIDNYNFTGFIDLVLRNEDGIVIVDHKSHSKFKSKKEKAEYLIQLYLYSIYIYEKYGEYPKRLIFNMFRIPEIIVEEFDMNKLEESKRWVKTTIEQIYNDEKFMCNTAKEMAFFCNNICGMRSYCKCSDNYLGE